MKILFIAMLFFTFSGRAYVGSNSDLDFRLRQLESDKTDRDMKQIFRNTNSGPSVYEIQRDFNRDLNTIQRDHNQNLHNYKVRKLLKERNEILRQNKNTG